MDRVGNMPFDPSTLKASAQHYSSSDSEEDEDDDAFQIPNTNPDADEFADHNPRKRRRTGRDAKESAALGVFGSESEDDGPGNRWKHKKLRHKGVAFVSSNDAKKSGDDDEDDDEDEPRYAGLGSMQGRLSEEKEDEEEDDGAPTGGLGFGFAAQKVAQDTTWAAGSRASQKFGNLFKKSTSSADTPLGRGFVPSSSFIPELKPRDDDNDAPATPIARPSAFSSARAGKGKKGAASGPNPNSFGARMMAKMGYTEGTGLGAEGQGRNVIIEANLRPQRAGLGVVREKTETERQEEKRQARMRGEVVVDSDEEEKKRKAARKKKALAGGGTSTPASGTSTPRRPKQKYLTMDEIKKAAPGLNIPDAFTPILDLTGPGKKMLTTSSGLMAPTGASAIPETSDQAESRKLARRAQNDFMAILEEWQSLQQRKAYAELQLQQEMQELAELEAGLAAHRSTVEQLGRLSLADEDVDDAQRRWDRVISILKETSSAMAGAGQESSGEEIRAIAIAALHPVFTEVLQSWDPLEDDRKNIVTDLVDLSNLLGIGQSQKTKPQQFASEALRHHRRKHNASPYETMIYKIWLPHVARAVRGWDVRDTDRLLNLWKTWLPVLPDFIRKQLLEQDIVRKLEDAVAKWEPKKRRMHHNKPHMWIFPWLQYLPAHHLDPKSSSGLVADVKRKFRQLVEAWEFEQGVIPGLAAWKDVLRQSSQNDQWRPLAMGHILPSIARYLRRKFEVDPADQAPYMNILNGVLEWSQIISAEALAEVMVAELFPKWHSCLYQWLVSDSVDWIQVVEWFEWWMHSVLPAEIRNCPSIAAEFLKGQRMVDLGLDLGDRIAAELSRPNKDPARKARSDPPSRTQTPLPKQAHHPQAAPAAQPKTEPASFRQQVEDWCAAHDLQFIPERKKVHAKGPLYRITARGDGKGGVLGYFGEDALWFENKGKESIVRGEDDFFLKIVHPGLAG